MSRPSFYSFSCTLLLATVWPLSAQQFGGSLAISGDHVLVGESQNQTLPGIVYVFEGRDGNWRETAQLMISDMAGPPDGFGRALAADGETMLAGAPQQSNGTGAVYVFQRDNLGAWAQISVLSPLAPADSAAFGRRVVLHGNVALISAPGENDGTGAAYVFRRDANGTWSQHARLVGGGVETGDGFGATAALDENMILVGSAVRRGEPGTVYAFGLDAATDRWMARGKLEAGELGERSGYGAALGLRDGVAFVGAPSMSQRAGAVFVFGYDTETGGWRQQSRLGAFDTRSNARFGSSIAFAASNIWIGAPGAGSSGSFYVFERDDAGDWTSATKLASGNLEERAAFASTAAIQGNLAVVGAGGVDSRAGAAVILERSAAGDWVERNTVINEVRGLPSILGSDVECVDDRAAGFECSEITVLSFLPIRDMGGSRGTRVNDVWGWTDPETDVEYAIVGRTDGTAFVDISDPNQPRYIGNLPKTEGSRSTIWRDMKVYRDHVYIVADGANEHGVQVFDLKQLRTAQNTPVEFEATFLYDGIHSAHNIVINEETGFAYAVGNSSGGETCGGGLHMISLEEPSHPTFAGCFADPATGRRKTGYSHDAQCVAYHGPDIEHRGKEICLGSNETALSISDVTDKNNPVALSAVSYPNVAYTHQGWLTEDHRYFYQNDEGDEPQGLVDGTRTLVWDVSDLDDPVLVKEHIATTKTTDHNLYVRGNLMYQSNYGSGLRILDVSDPENPEEIGFLDTTPYGGSGSWSNYPFFESGVIIATSTDDGLFIVKSTGKPRLIP